LELKSIQEEKFIQGVKLKKIDQISDLVRDFRKNKLVKNS